MVFIIKIDIRENPTKNPYFQAFFFDLCKAQLYINARGRLKKCCFLPRFKQKKV